MLDELVETKPERDFFTQGSDAWRAFTAFLLASTTNPASVGDGHSWGIGTATPDSIAISLSNSTLLTAGTDEAYDEITNVLKEWHELGKPTVIKVAPCFTRDDNGWTIRPRRPLVPASATSTMGD